MFTTLLEELVPGLESVNFGVSGYSTDQELLLYQHEGYKYKADIILILVTGNDLQANTESVVYGVYAKPVFHLENGNLVLHNYPVQQTPQLVHYAAKMVSSLYLMKGLNNLREQFRNSDTPHGEKLNSKGITNLPVIRKGSGTLSFQGEPAESLMMAELLELRYSVIEKQPKAKILMVFREDRSSFRRMCTYLKGEGISCFLLGPYLNEIDDELYLPGDLHWNARGHQIVAKVLAEAIEHEFARVETRPAHDGLKKAGNLGDEGR
jgi:hypothetical protein